MYDVWAVPAVIAAVNSWRAAQSTVETTERVFSCAVCLFVQSKMYLIDGEIQILSDKGILEKRYWSR